MKGVEDLTEILQGSKAIRSIMFSKESLDKGCRDEKIQLEKGDQFSTE